MNLLDRLLAHDDWTTRQLLTLATRLSDEELDRDLGIGWRTVRATLDHIIFNTEVWSALMAWEPVKLNLTDEDRTLPAMTARLERASALLAGVARGVEERGAWDERWVDTLDNPPNEKTYGGAIAHVITHSMHHRAQLLYMFKQLGVTDLPEGDVLSWEGTVTSTAES